MQSTLDTNALNELKTIQKTLSIEQLSANHKFLVEQIKCPPINSDETHPTNWTYATHVFGILLQICHELDRHDDLPIPVNDIKKVNIGLRKGIEYGLKPYLLTITNPSVHCTPYIVGSVNLLLKISSNKHFSKMCSRSDQHLVYTDILSSIFALLHIGDDQTKSEFENHLKNIKLKLSPAEYLKILFLIKGNDKHPSAVLIQQIIHKDLMQCLYRPGSFVAMCEALLPSITSLDQDEEILKKRLHCCTVISSIVGRRGYKKEFYHQFIDEIRQHLLKFINSNNPNQQFYTDVGVQCLNKLFSLELIFIRRPIYEFTLKFFERFTAPSELLAGAIVSEDTEFIDAIKMTHLTFCVSPSNETLPSDMLTSFMPLFFQLHHIFNESVNSTLKNDILAIIVRCLSNREIEELNKIVESVLFEEYSDSVRYLHPRITVQRVMDGESEKFTFKINSTKSTNDDILNIEASSHEDLDISAFLRPSTTLVNVLKLSNHNMLTYNVFLHLLKLFSKQFSKTTTSTAHSSESSELLDSENELSKAIERNFKRKYAIIHALNELILFKSFHGQFTENPHDIILMLDNMLTNQIEHIGEAQRSNQTVKNDWEEVLIVILSIIGDFMPRIHNEQLKQRLLQTLQKLRTMLSGEQWNTVLRKLEFLLGPTTMQNENSEFLVAKAILSETHHEPYTKVYAIMNMLKLVNKKDEETLCNAHTVLALAIRLLKEEDSYIFLNCIKLFIALINVLEDTVIESLIAEYHFDIEADAADIDFKLKIGEAIVKVTQGLGEMCYKYKSLLINCFLRGSCHRHDEFRTSNISNLGVVMRILSYQVHHFFQEVCYFFVFFV